MAGANVSQTPWTTKKIEEVWINPLLQSQGSDAGCYIEASEGNGNPVTGVQVRITANPKGNSGLSNLKTGNHD